VKVVNNRKKRKACGGRGGGEGKLMVIGSKGKGAILNKSRDWVTLFGLK